MADEQVPDALDDMAMVAVCPKTSDAWLWYCDEHDTHGNADSQGEAAHVAAAHSAFVAQALSEGEDVGPLCQTVVWHRVSHERLG